MQGIPLNIRVRRVLAVTVDDGLALSFDEAPSAYFPANLSQPTGGNSTFDGSPRSGLSAYTLYWQTTPADLDVGHRFEVLGDAVYELLAKPEPVTSGRQRLGYSAPCLPISRLYPRAADLKAMGVAAVIAEVDCAVFSDRENKGQRGTYHDTLCELPASAWSDIDGAHNLELHFGDGSAWKIAEASLSPEAPFVAAALRK